MSNDTTYEIVISDTTSCYGLRRLHILRAGKPVEAQERLEQVEANGGRVEAWLAWADDLGMQHLYMAWRPTMIDKPMYVAQMRGKNGQRGAGELRQAALAAARGHYRRLGGWPNQAATAQAGDWPERPEVEVDGGVVALTVRTMPGLQTGVVAVWAEAETPDGDAGGE